MATYNGEQYILDQIRSIQNQTYNDWILYIRDDGSTDDTVSVIKQIVASDSRIKLVEDDDKHLGCAKNFMKLLEIVEAPLYMLSDQDDVWFPEKIEKSVNAYRYCALHNQKNIPICIHTNSTLVDNKLSVICNSYWNEASINPDIMKNYNYLAICCYTQGASMLFNRELRKLCIPFLINDDRCMHDWWIATRCLKHGGLIYSIKEPLLYYRQHNNNKLGVRYGIKSSIFSRFLDLQNVFIKNVTKYKILKSDGYGSLFKYFYYKTILLYNLHIKKSCF